MIIDMPAPGRPGIGETWRDSQGIERRVTNIREGNLIYFTQDGIALCVPLRGWRMWVDRRFAKQVS